LKLTIYQFDKLCLFVLYKKEQHLFTMCIHLFEQVLLITFANKSQLLLEAMCGATFEDLEWIWSCLQGKLTQETAARDIIMALHFLKHYPTEIVGAGYFKLKSYKYYSQLVWHVLLLMVQHLPKLDFEQRHNQPQFSGIFANVLTIVDGTECPIQPPRSSWEAQKIYYSRKKKRHMLKYQAMCRTIDGMIIDCYGPFPGSVHDKPIFDSWFIKYNNELDTKEVILGDNVHARCSV